MTRSLRTVAAVAIGAAAWLPAAVAGAAPTASAVLSCGEAGTHRVDGFGRGVVLHVVGSRSSFVVTEAVLADGTVVASSPSAADRPLVRCTTVTPGGNAFTFTGFFTPVRRSAA